MDNQFIEFYPVTVEKPSGCKETFPKVLTLWAFVLLAAKVKQITKLSFQTLLFSKSNVLLDGEMT